MHTTTMRDAAIVAVLVALSGILCTAADAGWTVTSRGSTPLSAGSISGIQELSGVTYLGPAASGLHRFVAIQDENRRVISLDVAFSANGTISSATAVGALNLSVDADYEGIAYTGATRNSVFVSEESTPGVHEHSLVTGSRLKSVTLPSVFQNDRDNRAFEALTRSTDGTTMYTANEEALTVDGDAATQGHGTTVRLQRITDHGTAVVPGPQFAYNVDPIHAGSGPDRSGLVDMAMLPDGTLVVLERSRTEGSPFLQNRIYQVDFTGATDVSVSPFATGLSGKSFTPASKTLLWSGQATTGLISNFEGMTLGPQLANGNWVLLGVVDTGGSSLNPIVSFELVPPAPVCDIAGDYDCNRTVDSGDYQVWIRTFGSTVALAADGNGDGVIDAADYVVWRVNAIAEAAAASHNLAVPEPGVALLVLFAAPKPKHAPISSRIPIAGTNV